MLVVSSESQSHKDEADAEEWWDVPAIASEVGADEKTVMNNVVWGGYEHVQKRDGKWFILRSEVEREFFKTMAPDGYVTIKEAASRVPTTYSTMSAHAKRCMGHSAKRIGGRIFISADEVQGFRDYRDRPKKPALVASEYFPTNRAAKRVADTQPYRLLESALDGMAREFTARATELGIPEYEFKGEVSVVGKRVGADFEFSWRIVSGCLLFRDNNSQAWDIVFGLCGGQFDINITHATFLEAVHSALWWHLHHLVVTATCEGGR